MSRFFHSLTFLVTALIWLFLSISLGAIVFLTSIHGLGTSVALRTLHIHSALIGGVIQIIMGLWLTPMAAERPLSPPRPLPYLALNVGTAGMLIGFWMENPYLVGGFGIAVIMATFSLFFRNPDHALLGMTPGFTRWWYGIALIALLAGLLLGEGMTWNLLPKEQLGWVKVAHSHLTVLGFILLAMMGLVKWLFPLMLDLRLPGSLLTRMEFVGLPLSTILLVFGLVFDHRALQIGAGILLAIGVLLHALRLTRTALSARRPLPRAMSYLLTASAYLCLTAFGGILLAVNMLWMPPPVRVGQLHLMAYTHAFFLGFVVQSVLGLLAFCFPLVISKMRIRSHKKRKPFHTELTEMMGRWHGLQIWTLNLGIVGLGVVAALVWWLPLKSPAISIGAWISTFLLAVPLVLFAVNTFRVLRKYPNG